MSNCFVLVFFWMILNNFFSTYSSRKVGWKWFGGVIESPGAVSFRSSSLSLHEADGYY